MAQQNGLGHGEVSLGNRLGRWLAPEGAGLKLLIGYGVFVGLISLFVPVAVQSLVNSIAFGTLLQPILVLSAAIFGFLCLAGFLRLAQLGLIERLQTRLFVRASLAIGQKVGHLSLIELERTRMNALLNRFLEVATVQKTLSSLLLEGATLALQLLVSVILLSLYHPYFLVYSLLLSGVLLGLVWIWASRGVQTAREESYKKYEMSDLLEEIAENHLLYRSSRVAGLLRAKLNAASDAYVQARRTHFKVLVAQFAGTYGVQAVFSALLLGLGGVLVTQNQLSLGQLVAAEILVSSLLLGVTKLGKLCEQFYDLIASLDKLESLLDLEAEREGGIECHWPLDPQPVSVSLKNVSFVRSQDFSLEGIDLLVPAGSSLAVVGPNGSGKSTLIELIYGLRGVTSGEIRVHENSIRESSLTSWRSGVVLVQGAQWVDGTVLENLTLGIQGATLEKVRSLLAEFGLLDAVERLPYGLNTPLVATRLPFSKGQLQRLMLVRALMARPRLLLLDEALDSLDADSKEQAIESILRRVGEYTLIVATHSRELAQRCRARMTLDSGKPVASAPGEGG